MKRLEDITQTAAWAELKQMGFIKIRLNFQGLAYSFGAAWRDLRSGEELITVEPSRTYRDQNGKIRRCWCVATFHPDRISHDYCLTKDLLNTVRRRLTALKANRVFQDNDSLKSIAI